MSSETAKALRTDGGEFVIRKMNERDVQVATEKWIESELQVERRGGGSKRVMHHQWTNWPDKGAPASGVGAVDALQWMRRSPGPITIHCSAGIGRTGTLVALELCVARLERGLPLDVPKTVCRLREQRMSAIQTDEQYLYLHFALIEYIKRYLLDDDCGSPDVADFRRRLHAPLTAFVNKFKAECSQSSMII